MMKTWIACLALAAALAAAPSVARAADPAAGSTDLADVLVQTADTPQEHQALARYYRAKADESRRIAAYHREMGRHYALAQKATVAERQKKHCDRIAELNEQLAAQFEDLAKGHDEAAAQ